MTRLVFLVEEKSMQATLDILLPKILPGMSFLTVPHEGKSDLQKSIPRKLRGWKIPGDRFVVVHDKDGSDCRDLKTHLNKLCRDADRHDVLVRIVCHHLEAWFLGDLIAVETAFSKTGLGEKQFNGKFRDPDSLTNASRELQRLVKGYQKLSGARAIAPHLDPECNCSHSFRSFVKGVRHLAASSESA
ncbi:MAG: DUF4276 family protein [Gemmatimonadaceae bacterium]|nr:DUF4276 family protein [Gloeobacterales cyanobacterium ES-bin-141]